MPQIAQQLADWTPSDGGAEPDAPAPPPPPVRPSVKAAISAVLPANDFTIDKGSAADVRVGDTFDVFRLSAIKNAAGKVVFHKEKKVGTAQVTDVQDDGAQLHLLTSIPGVTLKEGDTVRTPAPLASVTAPPAAAASPPAAATP